MHGGRHGAQRDHLATERRGDEPGSGEVELAGHLRFWSDRGVDGFRIDVAHMLTKDLADPLPSRATLDALPRDGRHLMINRDDVHEVYAQWRAVFNEYDPPRTAVAEAWVERSRVPLYASQDSLATRYGLPHPARATDGRPAVKHGLEWVRAGGRAVELDRDGGLRRARAATLFLLGLPGSAYMYQGEELGLHEVAQIPDDERQDPTFFRTHGADYGRDGCRVPIPWSADGPSFGFGAGGVHLPQPDWFAAAAVGVEDADPDSTLVLYRQALGLRHELQTHEELAWVDTGRGDVLHYVRPGGWHVITNFGAEPYEVAEGEPILASVGDASLLVAPESTVWVRTAE